MSPVSKNILKNTLLIILVLLVFLFAIDLLRAAFGSLGQSMAESILVATSNPFIGLFIGLLVTAIIQSSSTSTSMIVALVAAGSLSLAEAVPMIMGANIGTTLTSTIVSLGYINNRKEFRRAISAGVLHDFFNILTVVILFPLEYYYGIVSWGANEITSLLLGTVDLSSTTPINVSTDNSLGNSVMSVIGNSFIGIIGAFGLLLGSIKFLSNIISKLIIGPSQEKIRSFIFNKPYKSFAWGFGITAAAQSSSITTSIVVPFVATNTIRLNRVTPFIIGANIGTTITAFIAVLFESNAAVSIAITHLLINLFGALIFLPFPIMRNSLISLSHFFGRATEKFRLTGLFYIILTFFIIPFMLIYLNQDQTRIYETSYSLTKNGKTEETTYLSKVFLYEKASPLKSDEEDQSIQTSYRRNNVLFFNQTFFLLNDVGSCWDDENEKGKFETCVVDYQISRTLSGGQSLNEVYTFEKRYSRADSLRVIYSFSAEELILIERSEYRNQKQVERNQLIEFALK